MISVELQEGMKLVELEKLRHIQYRPNGPSEDMLCVGCYAMKNVEQCTSDCWIGRLTGTAEADQS